MTEPVITDPMLPIPFVVVGNIKNNPDCTLLAIRPVDSQHLCIYKPGQFFMLYAFGCGEVPISINSDPSLKHSLTFTIRDVGGVTEALCALKKGDALGVRGPFGNGWPMEDLVGRDVVVMAGGLGCVPLRPVVYHLLMRRKDYGRISLLYGARTPEAFLFNKELQNWERHIDVMLIVDQPAPNWDGPVGHATDLVRNLDINPDNTSVVICGPEIMINLSADTMLEHGVPAQHIHISMERNMKCAIGQCGRCQFGPDFICKDGPVFAYDKVVERLLDIKEV